jgi:hypothetical protein
LLLGCDGSGVIFANPVPHGGRLLSYPQVRQSEEPAMTQILTPAPRLDSVPSLADRCDGCGAAAKLRVDMTAGGSLSFCGHHANQHAEEITRRAGRIAVVADFEWRGRVQ